LGTQQKLAGVDPGGLEDALLHHEQRKVGRVQYRNDDDGQKLRTPIWKMAGPRVISWYISMNEPGSGGCSDRVTARGRSATWVPVARDATMSCAANSFS
jgi:hypothetical protein